MIITKQLTVDLLQREIQDTVDAVQCDANTRAVAVTLKAGSTPWKPPEGFRASVAFRKPDGRSGWYDKLPNGTAACTVAENVVTAILAPEALTVAGKVAAAVVFQNENLDQLATFPFCVAVSENPAAGGVISNNYYNLQTLGQINAAMEDLQDQLDSIIDDSAVGEKAWSSKRVMEAVDDVDSSAAIVCNAQGSAITASDASDRQLRGLTLYGKTVQSGTPTPDAPVPLESAGDSGSIAVTVEGKNMLDYARWSKIGAYNASWQWVDNGVVLTSNGSAGFTEYTVEQGFPLIRVEDRQPITVSWEHSGSSGRFYMFGFDENKENLTVLTNVDASTGSYTYKYTSYAYISFRFDVSAGGTTAIKNVMVEKGSTVTAFEPSKTQTLTTLTPDGLSGIPVTSGGNYTDESGQQWICDEVDFARGVRIQRVEAAVHDGSEPWIIVSQLANGIRVTVYEVFKNKLKDPNFDLLCSHFVAQNSVPGIYQGSDSAPSYFVPFSTLDEWKAFLAQQYAAGTPLVTIAPLAEPIETPLTAEEMAAFAALHTNKPNTTVHNDGGAHMALEYIVNTKGYVDKTAEETNASIVELQKLVVNQAGRISDVEAVNRDQSYQLKTLEYGRWRNIGYITSEGSPAIDIYPRCLDVLIAGTISSSVDITIGVNSDWAYDPIHITEHPDNIGETALWLEYQATAGATFVPLYKQQIITSPDPYSGSESAVVKTSVGPDQVSGCGIGYVAIVGDSFSLDVYVRYYAPDQS